MADRFDHLKEALDRRLLERDEPPTHAHARKLLEMKGVKLGRVVRTCPEAILFVNEAGKAMTAWTLRKAAATDMIFEPGFPAWPE